MRKKFILAGVAAVLASALVVGTTSFALMTDRDVFVGASGKAGKLAISLSVTGVETSDYTASNLFDTPSAKAMDITVNNDGNVMADTVTTLTMTVTHSDTADNPADDSFSAYDLASVDGQAEFELYDADDVTINTSGYTIKSGAKPLCSDSGRVVDKNKITYTLPTETLAGSSTNYTDDERETDTEHSADSKAYNLALVVRNDFTPTVGTYDVKVDINSSATPHRGGSTKNWTSKTTAEANYRGVVIGYH